MVPEHFLLLPGRAALQLGLVSTADKRFPSWLVNSLILAPLIPQGKGSLLACWGPAGVFGVLTHSDPGFFKVL